jgi:hypothetical protein
VVGQGIAMHFIPAALAAKTPLKESSMTKQFIGKTPILVAANK